MLVLNQTFFSLNQHQHTQLRCRNRLLYTPTVLSGQETQAKQSKTYSAAALTDECRRLYKRTNSLILTAFKISQILAHCTSRQNLL